jgi:hypothetical protein
MMRRELLVGCATLVTLIAIAIFTLILLRPAILGAERSRRAEADYQKLVESGSDQVYTYYPEIFDRICLDKKLANRITFVHLSPSGRSIGDYSSLSRLPNVKELEVSYANDVHTLVPTINRMPSLKRASFVYCDDSELAKLKNPKLEILKIHAYQARHVSDAIVKACQYNMPSCTITVTGDE